MDDLIENARSKKRNFESLLDAKQKEIIQIKELIGELDKFIDTWMQKNTTYENFNFFQVSKGNQKNLKKEDISKLCVEIILEAGVPLSRKALFEALTKKGINFYGSNKEMILSTMLWRTPEIITRHGKAGYWPAGFPLP